MWLIIWAFLHIFCSHPQKLKSVTTDDGAFIVVGGAAGLIARLKIYGDSLDLQ